MATINNKYNIEHIFQQYYDEVERIWGRPQGNNSYIKGLNFFTEFLKLHKYPTINAEKLYDMYLTNKTKAEIERTEIRTKKENQRKDNFIKKGIIPAVIVGSVFGGIMGIVGASGIVAGSKVLGFIPVTSNAITDFFATASICGILGTIASYATIKIKDTLVTGYYNLRYGSYKKIKQQLIDGVNFEKTQISKLMNLTSKSTEEILSLQHGKKNIFNRLDRWSTRTGLDIINRNRFHHIQHFTEDLMKDLDIALTNALKNGIDSTNTKEITAIVTLLKKTNEFYKNNVEIIRNHHLLYCDKNCKHNKKMLNLDIMADLDLYIKQVSTLNPTNELEKQEMKEQVKEYKKSRLDTLDKNNRKALRRTTEYNIINDNEGLIANMVKEKYSKRLNEFASQVSSQTLNNAINDLLTNTDQAEFRPVIILESPEKYKVSQPNINNETIQAQVVDSINLDELEIDEEKKRKEEIKALKKENERTRTFLAEKKLYEFLTDEEKVSKIITYLNCKYFGEDLNDIYNQINILKNKLKTSQNKNAIIKPKTTNSIYVIYHDCMEIAKEISKENSLSL